MNRNPAHSGNTTRLQESWNLTYGTTTGKMATKQSVSPLLCLRPGFPGPGRGGTGVSIITELFRLSKLSLPISKSFSFEKSQYEEIDEGQNFHETTESCQDDGTNIHSENPTESTNTTANPVHQVFELDSNGIPSKPIQYSFSNQTTILFKTLESLNIAFRTEIYKTKEHRLNVDKSIFYCKNLFLKDRKGKFFLFICHEDLEVDLKRLRKTLNAYRNFNFATPDEMRQLLWVEPGGVTPLALMNRQDAAVTMVVCKSLLADGATVMFHPMDSNLATEITMTDLFRFLKHFGHTIFVVKSN